jgi:hypothetical protein
MMRSMKRFRGLWIGALLLLFCLQAQAEELNARVSVLTPTLQGIDRSIVTQLQKDISDYLNKTKFTTDQYEPIERIKCSFTITVNGLPTQDRFECVTQIQIVRPVFNSTYESVILNFNDRVFNFNYVPFQQIQFSENAYVANLTSLLNFWAYMIIGIDNDCMTLEGGTPYFQRAQNQANLAQNSGELGWRSLDGNFNRYWLMENLLNASYKQMRTVYYNYHRKGLDMMQEDVNTSRTAVLTQLTDLQKLYQTYPNIYVMRVFFDTKRGEIVNIFRKAPTDEKQILIRIMGQLNAADLQEYMKINEN